MPGGNGTSCSTQSSSSKPSPTNSGKWDLTASRSSQRRLTPATIAAQGLSSSSERTSAADPPPSSMSTTSQKTSKTKALSRRKKGGSRIIYS